MKTIEEKAKAYDEALERAKNWIKDGSEPSTKKCLELLFPELRESEDEKIIRNLINAFTEYKKSGGVDFHGIDINTLLSWLEKQKKLFESGKGLYYYDGENTTYCGYPATEENPYDFAMSLQEKSKEQKPADDKAFEEWIDDWYQGSKEAGGDIVMSEAEFKNWSRGIRNMYQQKPAWSEEDESILNNIIAYRYLNIDDLEWIKKLPKRFNLQPKQEWSEEETKDLVHILKVLDDCYAYGKHDLSKTDHDNLTSMIKSLPPSWKPSEEQMKGLKFFLDFHRPQRNAGTTAWKEFDSVDSLYNDLLKLKQP